MNDRKPANINEVYWVDEQDERDTEQEQELVSQSELDRIFANINEEEYEEETTTTNEA